MNAQAQSKPPVDEKLVEELLRGSIDLHIHTGPSVMTRKLHHLEEIEQAEAAGMKAILLKDHLHSNTPMLEIIKRHRNPQSDLHLLSGVPCNNALGGLNPYAVELGLQMGARLVWMPTLCAENHLRSAFRYDLAGRYNMIPPHAIPALNDRGELRDEIKEILDLIAKYDAVLCGGHFHISEMYPLFEEAKRRGVRRLHVAHPTFWVEAQIADLRDLAAMGVYLEHCACQFIDCPSRKFTGEEFRSYVEAAGIDRTIMSTDLGQPENPYPAAGFRAGIRMLLELDFTPEEIRKMISINPSRLIGLDGEAP
jgi:hypothetical protein